MTGVTRTRMWDEHISTQALGQLLGIDSIDTYVARRQLRWLGHTSRMDLDSRLPRRMLSSWVPHPRPPGAPSMTYGRSVGKALALFQVDPTRWHELAADRGAWRRMLEDGVAPAAFRPQARPPSPRISRIKPMRSCARATVAAIDESLRKERLADVTNV